MDNTQHTYFAELKLALQKAGYTVQPVEDGLLPIEWNDCAKSPRAAASASERMILQTLQQKWLEAGSQILPVWSGST